MQNAIWKLVKDDVASNRMSIQNILFWEIKLIFFIWVIKHSKSGSNMEHFYFITGPQYQLV